MERGSGWLKRGRRVPARYDRYAQRCLGFSVLGGGLDRAELKSQRKLARMAVSRLNCGTPIGRHSFRLCVDEGLNGVRQPKF